MHRKLSLVIALLLVLAACQPKVIYKYAYYSVPSLAPGTRPEMNTAGFWIGRHPDPDALIMTEEEIAEFNACIIKKTKAVRDIRKLSFSRDGRALDGSLRKMLSQHQGYVDSEGAAMTKDFVSGMEELMGLGRIPERIDARWAYVVRPADQRLLPTDKPFYKSTTDTLIDRLQNNALDIATPVLVVAETTDRTWVYAISPDSEGWLNAANVAFCAKEEMERYESSGRFVVAIDAKTDLYADPWLRQHHSSIQMGTRLPLLRQFDNMGIQVLVPARSESGRCTFEAAYASPSSVHQGYLPYTPRTAISQAFRLLNAPYGWGGMYGEQDCSRFVQEVFATMGIVLPRNSSQQGRVGRLVANFTGTDMPSDRQAKLSQSASGGITTLQFPGHIMLFLGTIDSKPYAIHDLFAYTEPAQEEERLVPINRVVVSSLAIGEGTKKGSFLMRLQTVRELNLEPGEN